MALTKSATDPPLEGEINESTNIRAGVRKIQLISQTWTRKDLIIAFAGLYLITFIFDFTNYATSTYTAYATSAFKQHSLLSAARVVATVTNLLTYPFFAKLGDVFGRGELFTFSLGISTLALVFYAACQNIETYFVGVLFDSIGGVGFSITQQIFIADTTSLLNRGIWSSLPDTIGSIPTLYIGTIVADQILDHSTWRWGYGMWAIILPFCSLPFIITIFVLQNRATKHGHVVQPPKILANVHKGHSVISKSYQLLWVELDCMGALLLVAGLALFLIPLSLTGSGNSTAWGNAHIIAMLVVGVVLFVAFIAWTAWIAKNPFIPYKLIKDRTVIAACILCMLDFFHYAVFTTFFPSYLQVAGHFSAGHATRIDNALRVAFQVSSLVVALLMKFTHRAKIWILIGVPLLVLGQGLQIYFVNINGDHGASEAAFVTAKTLAGVGRGFYQTAAQVTVQAVVPREDVGIVTAVFFASMNLGGAIGTSVSGAVWRSTLPEKLSAYLPATLKDLAMSIFKSIVIAQKYSVDSEARTAIDRSYRESQKLLAIAATSALAPMLLIMWFIKSVDLRKDQIDKEQSESIVPQGSTYFVPITAKHTADNGAKA
ncbi:Nn.00g046320.m01.CDS01 [Neocucurbitaria sp. VM-36]